jgi:plasmid stabilization system protein ParE
VAQQYQVVISVEARTDLRHELEYIRKKSSLDQARRVNDELQQAIRSLATFPERHGKLEQIGTKQRVYRFLPKWSFMIIYRVEESVFRVRVVSIFCSSQDPAKLEDIKGR